MQIPIKMSTEKNGVGDWVLLELQGDLESRTQQEMRNKFIGDLHFTKQGGVPVLIIGHHILYGKVQDLEKPFLYLRKTIETSTSMVHEDSSTDNNGSGQEYCVEAVVRKKLLFKTRPKPIIACMKNNNS